MVEISFKKYVGRMVVHTPLHIGMGRDSIIRPFEYWIENDKLFKGDFNKLLSYLNEDKSRKLIDILEKRENTDFLTIIKELGLEDKKNELITNVFDFKIKGRPNIEQFISHTGWKKYIPGSSIKGAILTGIYYRELKSKGFSLEEVNRSDISNIRKNIEGMEKVFGRYLMVEDIELPSEVFIIGRNIRRKINGKIVGRFSFLECIKPGSEFNISIYIEESQLKFNELINSVNEFYKIRLEKIKKITNKDFNIVENNNMILQIGKFGGNFTKSVLNLTPKTYAFINDLPAGWISIRFEI